MAQVERILYACENDAKENNNKIKQILNMFQEKGIRAFDDPMVKCVAMYECLEQVGDLEAGSRMLVFSGDEDDMCDAEDIFFGDFDFEGNNVCTEYSDEEDEFIEDLIVTSLEEDEDLFEGVAEGYVIRKEISLHAYPDYLRQAVEGFSQNIVSQTKGFDFKSLDENEWIAVCDIIASEAERINRCFTVEETGIDEEMVRRILTLDGIPLGTGIVKDGKTILSLRRLESDYELNEFCKYLNWTGLIKDALIEEVEIDMESALETIREEKDYAAFLSEMGDLEEAIYRLQHRYGINPKKGMLKALAANQVDLIKEILEF